MDVLPGGGSVPEDRPAGDQATHRLPEAGPMAGAGWGYGAGWAGEADHVAGQPWDGGGGWRSVPPRGVGDGWDGGPAQPGGRRPRSRRWAGGVAALVLLVVGGAAYLSLWNTAHRSASVSPPSQGPATVRSTSPTSEKAELAQVTALLRRTAAARAIVIRATGHVGACTMPPAHGISLMHRAVRERRGIIASLQSVPVGAIAHGRKMAAGLIQALQSSVAADHDFIGWMHHLASSGKCPISVAHDSSYQAGLRASGQATTAKRAFCARWNRLARRFGQPKFTPSQL